MCAPLRFRLKYKPPHATGGFNRIAYHIQSRTSAARDKRTNYNPSLALFQEQSKLSLDPTLNKMEVVHVSRAASGCFSSLRVQAQTMSRTFGGINIPTNSAGVSRLCLCAPLDLRIRLCDLKASLIAKSVSRPQRSVDAQS